MGLLALFRRSPPSAHVAKERLRIIVQQERSARGGGPDYMPLLRRELLEVIRKYVNVDPAAVQINVEREDGQEVLEFSVALPEKARRLLELASPPPLQPGRLRLLEPADSSHAELLRQLIDGTYAKPFIEDCGPLRYLHFDLDNVQSVMRLDDPDALCLAYTRKMMAFLLFNSEPRRVLQLGLGGGSLAKFCYRHLPDASITVLEIDKHVLALREEFRVPPDGQRFHVVQGDAVEYIAGRAPREDIILVDACDRTGMAPTLSVPDLYSNLRRRLTVGGVLVINLCGDEADVENHIARIRGVFGQRLIALPAREDGNLIVLGFRTDPRTWDGAELDVHARKLEERFGLAFPRYVRQMEYGLRGM